MLTEEDSKRVADRMISAIDRIEARSIDVLNQADLKIRRIDIEHSIKSGLKDSIGAVFASRYSYGKTWLEELMQQTFKK